MTKALLLFNIIVASYAFSVCSAWEVVNTVSNGHSHVTASTNYLWSVNGAHQIYRCQRPCKGKWVKTDGSLMQIDASDDEVWGVNRHHQIFKRPVDASKGWTRIGGGLKHVSPSGNGYVWGVNNGGQIFRCMKPCTGRWQHIGGSLKMIDGGYAYVYGVNNGGAVYTRPIDGSKGWRNIPVPVPMNHITASGNDDIFATSRQGDVYRCKKPCIGEWEKMSTNYNKLTQCDASYDALFAVNSGGTVFRHKTGK